MKRIFLLIIAGLMLINFSGCGAVKTEKDIATTEPSLEAEEENGVWEEREKELVEEKENEKTARKTFEDLTADEHKKLNMFLSNFSEAYFDNYSANDYQANRLISFAFTHNSLNNPNKIFYEEMYMGISASDVNTTLDKYLGITIPNNSVGEWTYSDGNYYMDAASGETYAYFSIATDITDNGDGTFEVEFTKFFDNNNVFETSLPQWYTYTIEQAKENCEECGSGVATVREKIYGGKQTYELISYYE